VTQVRFEFGRNWTEYSKQVEEADLDLALVGLQKLLPHGLDLRGKSFLDIGSGSGLHSVAAARLGFSPTLAVDYDGNSVSATQSNASRFGVGWPQAALSSSQFTTGHRFTACGHR
jgi:ribosomal protein L11 methylase PrmA